MGGARLQVFYGGTFDPVHDGHLAVARTARDVLDAQVSLVPAADPPHKDETHADAGQRVRMLELAIGDQPGLAIDRRELERDGPSYSVDTLRELRRARGPEAALAWLVGGDSLQQLDRWHRWRELFALAHVLAVPRPGASVDAAVLAQDAPIVHAEIAERWRDASTLAQSPAGGFAVLPLPQPREESSTELRRRIRAGEPWHDWVPSAVARYIMESGLYGASPACRDLHPRPL
jgi:nicotinate-nucleotide adenylyltransferase